MKIAGLVRLLEEPGGAELSMSTLLNNINKEHSTRLFGHSGSGARRDEVRTLDIKSISKDLPSIASIPLTYLESYLRFKAPLKKFNPDLIFAQHELALLGSRYSAPQVLFLRDESLIPSPVSGKFTVETLDQFAEEAQRCLFSQVIFESDVVVANSKYTAQKYRDEYGIQPKIIYPFIDLEKCAVNNTGEHILHVNPKEHKGINTTLEVSDILAEHKFIIAGRKPSDSILSRIQSKNNVEYIGYLDDMKNAYKRTKIVIMPSKTEEPFGRIPVESGISGIPIVAANIGGLPESVGINDLLVKPNEATKYAGKIRSVLDNYDYYSRLARKNAKEKDHRAQINKLNQILKDRKYLNSPLI